LGLALKGWDGCGEGLGNTLRGILSGAGDLKKILTPIRYSSRGFITIL